uniref:Signal peptidase complex subunit 1 n=1 Tax=Xenopsylla cheopis TaxID=163159 RepID=A0A6M2DNW1_XENCH
MDFITSIPTHMDYEGQARAEKLSRIIITFFGVIGLIYGYVIQQFSMTVYILGAGFLVAILLTVPAWPFYRLKPLNWQKPRNQNQNVEKQKKK